MRRRVVEAVVCACILSGGQSFATIHQLSAGLDGAQETPPVASPGIGSLDISLDDVTGFVTVTSGDYSGLLSSVTAAHIHGPAGLGVGPAGVVLPLTHTGGTSGTLGGSGTLARSGFTTAELISAMLAGETYVNVHTSLYPGGEIRGQLTVVPEPATAVGLFAVVGLGLLRRRRA